MIASTNFLGEKVTQMHKISRNARINGFGALHDVSLEMWMQHPHSPAISFSRWIRRV
jgi:hypothetical protein